MKNSTKYSLLTLFLFPSFGQAALYVNAGSSPTGGIGPTGADSNYVQFTSTHESADSGNLVPILGVTFAEGGFGATTYDVGIEVTWSNGAAIPIANSVKQAFSRSQNPSGAYSEFYQDWIGMDSRGSQGGGGPGTTMTLTLTNLPASSDFTITTYHFDTHDQAGSFTTSASGATVYDNGRANGSDSVDETQFQYDFNLTSDGSGTASIDFVNVSGSWNTLNGFDVVAVPEPSSTVLLGLGALGFLSRRRRK